MDWLKLTGKLFMADIIDLEDKAYITEVIMARFIKITVAHLNYDLVRYSNFVAKFCQQSFI